MQKSKTSVEFKDNRIEIKNEINKRSLNWLEEVSGEIESQTVRNTRTDTGNTKKLWQHYIDEKAGKAYIGNPSENAIWEELGTGDFAIDGMGRKGAWYVPIEWITGAKKPTFNGKVEIVYSKEGKAFYKTNGKRPTRAMTKAFETVKPKALKRAEEIFGGLNQ